ncbi:MAG: Na(+)/H(+) antiporter subunit B [Pseudomonadota bacterium]
MRRNPILREISHFLLPAIMLFALYVQFHGEYSPGGGFQAGVIFASAIILFAILHGDKKAENVLSLGLAKVLAAIGVLLYGGVGIASMLLGGNFLDYDALAEDPITGQLWGILLIEAGVGITVATVIIAIFYTFSKYKD